MLAIHCIRTVYIKACAFLAKKAAYHQLSKLDPYLLEDMGVELKAGRIISTRPAKKSVDADLAALTVVVDNSRKAEAAAFEPPPKPSQG